MSKERRFWGDWLHSETLLTRSEEVLVNLGISTQREFPVALPSGGTGRIDLFAQTASMKIAIEAELTAQRVKNDLDKAAAVGATHLFIITPNPDVRQRVARAIKRGGSGLHTFQKFAFTYPQFRHHFRNKNSLISRPSEKTIQEAK